MDFDPNHGWRNIEARLDRTTGERLRQVLSVVRDHVYAEAVGDFDMLLGTLSADPQYHFWGPSSPFAGGPKGLDAVIAHYRGVYEDNRQMVDWDIERIVADEDCVITEGKYRQLYPGWALVPKGCEVDDPNAVYEVRAQLLILWPVDAEGQLTGEDAYSDGPMYDASRVRRLDGGEVPDAFHESLER
jgi:SnoaL-like protein